MKNKKRPLFSGLLLLNALIMLYCFLNFTRTDASGANILPYNTVVFQYPYFFDIGFPHFIGYFMRVADVMTELYTFATNFTLCHEFIPTLKMKVNNGFMRHICK
jgi:hypothetical protein